MGASGHIAGVINPPSGNKRSYWSSDALAAFPEDPQAWFDWAAPPETLPKVFEVGFSTKGPRQGTGLGLNIVQRLVKEARGLLHVHTKAGEGTSFRVYLPAVPLAAA